MRLYEYEATDIFERYGILTPERKIASSPEEAQKISEKLGFPVVLKAQVLVGGRGLAGGVRVAQNPQEAYTLSTELLGSKIKGLPVRSLLVVKKAEEDDDDESLETIIEEGSGRDEDQKSKASELDNVRKESAKQ